MKKLILLTVVSILIGFNIQGQETYIISPENSTIEWVGEKVSGAHSGYINLCTVFNLGYIRTTFLSWHIYMHCI